MEKNILRETLEKPVIKHWKDNFKRNGLWNSYVLPIQYMPDEEFGKITLDEVFSNGQLVTRAHYVKIIQRNLKRFASLSDWEKWAEEFVQGFDKNGNVKMEKD